MLLKCLESLERNISRTDVLILTSSDWASKLEKKSNYVVKTLESPEGTNYLEYTWLRYSVYDHFDLSYYEKLLYLDIDILVTGSLRSIFELEMSKPVLASSDETFGKLTIADSNPDFYGGKIVDLLGMSYKWSQGKVFSSGVMLFDLSYVALSDRLKKLRLFFEERVFPHSDRLGVFCGMTDQPTVNLFFHRHKLVDPLGLDQYVSKYRGGELLHGPIVHFANGVGNSTKLEDMSNYMTMLSEELTIDSFKES